MSTEAQTARILAHLKRGHTLTPLEALRRFGCMRLSARVDELKRDGHDVRKRMVDVGGKRVARYVLAH